MAIPSPSCACGPRARWTAVYDELYAGLTSGEDALTGDAATIALLEGWDLIVEALRRDACNTRRRELYRLRKREAIR
jgi:hypothetical protein